MNIVCVIREGPIGRFASPYYIYAGDAFFPNSQMNKNTPIFAYTLYKQIKPYDDQQNEKNLKKSHLFFWNFKKEALSLRSILRMNL